MYDTHEPSGLGEEILMRGPICLYKRKEYLQQDIVWFENNRYQIVATDVSRWNDDNAHRNIKEVFDFPDYYGENLNAFNDCLGDMYNKRYKGLVIVLYHYDEFYYRAKDLGTGLLDHIAELSRQWLISGQHLLALLQSRDGHIQIDPVGFSSVHWNKMEWMNSDRD